MSNHTPIQSKVVCNHEENEIPGSVADEEVRQLKVIVSSGEAGARMIRRANIMLMMDENRNAGVKQFQVAAMLSTSELTVRKVAKQYSQEGLDSTLTLKRSETQHPPIKLDGAV